jgi:hypothetical protein
MAGVWRAALGVGVRGADLPFSLFSIIAVVVAAETVANQF